VQSSWGHNQSTIRAMTTGSMPRWTFVLSAALVLSACGDDRDGPRVAEDVFAPLGEPIPAATPEQRAAFERGEAVALRRFQAADGLGPHFNLTFCGGCHEKPVFGGSAGRYRNFFLTFDERASGSVVAAGVNGIQAQYSLDPATRFPTDEDGDRLAIRNPIPFFGTGLIAELPEEAILANQDPFDEDGDGISGRANFDRGFVGRFGRKAQTVSIEGFIRGPLFNHLGITTDPLTPEQQARLPVPSATDDVLGRGARVVESADGAIGRRTESQAAAPAAPIRDEDGIDDPELDPQDLFDLVAWSMLLAAPEPDPPTPRSERGKARFQDAGCADCHVPSLEGPRGLVPLYSDLLLHDMGEDMADGIFMGNATGSEFRTQPLWGIVAVGPYLHDGRADTLDEAIRFHGGEAAASRDAYLAMTPDERDDLLVFLGSLGGGDQFTEGLVPPNEPIPETGAYGAPLPGLDAEALARFEAGRRLYDRDHFVSEGLGNPTFNGDACRACHFDPVIGGAGPADLDVTREGTLVGDVFTAPARGTLLHRHALVPERPEIAPGTNVVELRQTPHTFGLGLLERVPEADILALADPDDLDADGIRGRAHWLSDGRLGRFGWKGAIPSVAEFVRDAVFNELGMTLPVQDGLTFGEAEDADAVADPEATPEMLDTLGFFLANLDGPPRTPTDPGLEAEGEVLFAEVGCASCHVPMLETADGEPVRAYTDLLLHDVQEPGYRGVEEGNAGVREFRTAPLWGLATSAPYWHDGRAFTVEDAIARHHAEGASSRDAYQALGADDRAALIAFLRSL
jgi:CxxC motif-containing protein (DUF1111 family)